MMAKNAAPLPDPLVPAEVDLRDFSFMPLALHQLRRSKQWLIAKRRPELGFYCINLWAASWHEVPAASLEDDDDVLADLAMCESEHWAEVKSEVLRGWIKCGDGRLYHPVVAEKALEAWAGKLEFRERAERFRKSQSEKGKRSVEKRRLLKTKGNFEPDVNRNSTVVKPDINRAPTDLEPMKGTGKGTGKGTATANLEPVAAPDRSEPGPIALDGICDRLLAAARMETERIKLTNDPMRMLRHHEVVKAWIASGVDPDRDAVPVLRLASGRTGYAQPRSLSYFTGMLVEAKGRNSGVPPAPRGYQTPAYARRFLPKPETESSDDDDHDEGALRGFG